MKAGCYWNYHTDVVNVLLIFSEKYKHKFNKYSVADTTFQRGQSKSWENLSSKSNSIEEQMVWICIVFTFNLLESWSRGESECKKTFYSKTRSLAFVLWCCGYILSARDQVFCVKFLLRDVKNDTVSNCSKIASCWLVLVFNIVVKSLKAMQKL